MQTFAEISAVREHLKTFKREGRKIAFVPTMGNLPRRSLNFSA